MLELAEKLSGKAAKMLLNPSRKFLWETEVVWSDIKQNSSEKIVGLLLLFNDLLVLTEYHKKKQKVVHVIPYGALQPKFAGTYSFSEHFDKIFYGYFCSQKQVKRSVFDMMP